MLTYTVGLNTFRLNPLMLIHADFQQTILIKPQDYHWRPSPNGAVNRVMFERIGHEKARATSIVEYPKGANFPAHAHPLGEEILVLSGILMWTQDFRPQL